MHTVGNFEGEVGGGSPGAPGDVAEGRAVRDHAVHPLEQVLDTLLRLGREVLEREQRPAIGRCLLDLFDHLHIKLLEASPPGACERAHSNGEQEGGGMMVVGEWVAGVCIYEI